ncbi:Radial spoke head protein 3 [Podochytrium sp. JEL0797]|nr:Radial spoke head protein 3 [Podochytrium sp. JEL0797]
MAEIGTTLPPGPGAPAPGGPGGPGNDASDNSAKLYVGRLPRNADKRDLDDLFGKYGRVLSLDVKQGGFAFVEYEDTRDAEDAIQALNNFPFEGERISVEWTLQTPPHPPASSVETPATGQESAPTTENKAWTCVLENASSVVNQATWPVSVVTAEEAEAEADVRDLLEATEVVTIVDTTVAAVTHITVGAHRPVVTTTTEAEVVVDMTVAAPTVADTIGTIAEVVVDTTEDHPAEEEITMMIVVPHLETTEEETAMMIGDTHLRATLTTITETHTTEVDLLRTPGLWVMDSVQGVEEEEAPEARLRVAVLERREAPLPLERLKEILRVVCLFDYIS